MERIIENAGDLQDYLQPMPLDGREVVEYHLPTFKSRLAMEMLQAATRKQARVFEEGTEIVHANVDVLPRTLRIDLRHMNHLNEAIKEKVSQDAVFQVRLLRKFHLGRERLEGVASRFEHHLSDGSTSLAELVEYFDLITSHHELGVLKFCYPESLLRENFTAVLRRGGDGLEHVLTPRAMSLLGHLYRLRLELAVRKLSPGGDEYRAALRAYQDRYGFLEAEDMDFREHDSLERFDAKIDRLARQYRRDPAALRARMHRLDEAVAKKRAARRRVVNEFLTSVAEAGQDRIWYFNQLGLWECLFRHEETNRFHKMRFLRNMRQLFERLGLAVFEAGVLDVLDLMEGTSGRTCSQYGA